MSQLLASVTGRSTKIPMAMVRWRPGAAFRPFDAVTRTKAVVVAASFDRVVDVARAMELQILDDRGLKSALSSC